MGYQFLEKFDNFDESHLPYGIEVEASSHYKHKHVRIENNNFYIASHGNKYLCRTPKLKNAVADINFSFCYSAVNSELGFTYIFRYDKELREGLFLSVSSAKDGRVAIALDKKSINATTRLASSSFTGCQYIVDDEKYSAHIEVFENKVKVSVFSQSAEFEIPEDMNRAGYSGVETRIFTGEMQLYTFSITSDDTMENTAILKKKTVKIPKRNGGSINFKLSYEMRRVGGQTVLYATLHGGPQDRPNEAEVYPRGNGQWESETARITSPYVSIYKKGVKKPQKTQKFASGTVLTWDPDARSPELFEKYFNYVKFPLNMQMILDGEFNIDEYEISFGYDRLEITAYWQQADNNIEFIYDFASGKLIYEGKKRGLDNLVINSPKNKKAVRNLEKTVYDYKTVKRHLEENHYFAEDEKIQFTITPVLNYPLNSVKFKVTLENAYFEPIKALRTSVKENKLVCRHAPLPCGVYHINAEAYVSGKLITCNRVAFEVYDESGEKAAPLESGLPFLYSMPNEQKYVDRDQFDMWSPMPSNNLEHYYTCSMFTGDVGVKRRIWEMNKKFGRKWFVWNCDHRTLSKAEHLALHDTIHEHCDYSYIRATDEYYNLRHGWMNRSIYTPGMVKLLQEFLDIYPDARGTISKDATTIKDISNEELNHVFRKRGNELIKYGVDYYLKDFEKQNEEFRKTNKNWGRAAYGPLHIYTTSLVGFNSAKYLGYPTNDEIGKTVFTGWAQLEDYPYSCSYHTYRGAYAVKDTLLHAPSMRFYPEQYSVSYGGCADGAVSYAAPPFGKGNTVMQPYFEATHAFEYAFNTPSLSKNGFRYWDTYGFMQRAFMREYVEGLIKGWSQVVKHKPAKPARTFAVLSYTPDEEERFATPAGTYNISEKGVAYIDECSRYAGIPCGFSVSLETVMQLTPDTCDMLVLPTMSGVPSEVIKKIRSLYESGVALVAISDVSGLEDIFGVEKQHFTATVNKIHYYGEEELISPSEVDFIYKASDAEVVLYAEATDGERYAVLTRHNNAILITAPVLQIGYYTFPSLHSLARQSISELLRKSVCESLVSLTKSEILGKDNLGTTHFYDVHGNELLLAIDYSDYDIVHDETHTTKHRIKLGNEYKGVELLYGEEPILIYEDGRLTEIEVDLHYEESILLKLIR